MLELALILQEEQDENHSLLYKTGCTLPQLQTGNGPEVGTGEHSWARLALQDWGIALRSSTPGSHR